jgi:two-component system, cell cycle sensor histidine kinase and response regulator CckA
MRPTDSGAADGPTSEERPQTGPLSLVRAISLLFSPELDDPLDDLLALVGEGMGVSRAYLFQLRRDGRRMDNTHEWCAPDVRPEIDGLQDVSAEHFPWWMERLRSGEGVVASALSDLPDDAEAERTLLAAQGIEAVLVLPLRSSSGELLGFMGFDEVRGPRRWTERERESLQLICQLGTRELERRRALQALRRVQTRLVRTERIARVGGWEFEPDTGRAWWSDQAHELLGISPTQEPATLFDFFQRIHPDDRERTRSTFLQVLDDGSPFRFECRVIGEGPGSRHLEVQGALGDRRGSRMVVGTIQDITERLLLEDQLRQAQRMEAVGQLAGGVAHDFNNILSLILGTAAFLLDDSDEADPRRSDILQILQAAERGSQLTRQLLAFSRKQMPEPSRFEVGRGLREVEALVRRLVPEDVEVRVEVPEEVGYVRADPGQLEQVIVNLVVNARDAMADGDGGRLHVFAETRELDEGLEVGSGGQRLPPGRYAVIGVADDGRGMSPAVRARIFDPFFTTKPAGEGAGLGLSSASGVVQQCGGGIRVESEEGRGSRFLVHLPLVQAPSPVAGGDGDELPSAREESSAVETAGRVAGGEPVAETAPSPRQLPAEEQPLDDGRVNVLLVEDDAQLAGLMERILERAGYGVLSTHDPAHAIRLSAEHPARLDLLVTDVVMPEIDGRKLAWQIQRHRPGIRVLFMSGYATDVISRKGVMEPEDQFLAKPFDPERLLSKVREVLAATAPAL